MPDISLLAEISQLYNVSIPEVINGERGNENVEEVRKTARAMADYAGSEKEVKIKSIRDLSCTGTVALAALAVSELLENSAFWAAKYIHLYCQSLVYASVLMIFLHSTGLFYKIKYKNGFNNLTAPLKITAASVAAFAVGAILRKAAGFIF